MHVKKLKGHRKADLRTELMPQKKPKTKQKEKKKKEKTMKGKTL